MSNLLGGSLRKESKMVKEISTTFILDIKLPPETSPEGEILR